MAEWTPVPEVNPEEISTYPRHDSPGYWIMHFDGSLTLKGAGAGVVVTSPTGEELRYVVQLQFRASNNMAEYEGLIAGL